MRSPRPLLPPGRIDNMTATLRKLSMTKLNVPLAVPDFLPITSVPVSRVLTIVQFAAWPAATATLEQVVDVCVQPLGTVSVIE